jgi:predicted O-methyltransferase YrrM
MSFKDLFPQSTRDALAWLLSRRELHRLMQSKDLRGIIQASFRYHGTGVFRHIYALQKESEIMDLAERVRALQPKIVVEIGTAKGGTLFIWSRSNPQLSLLVSIDLPGGNFGGGYDSRREKLYHEFTAGHPDTKLVLLRCDSHAESTVAMLKTHLAGRQIDFLWIDGDHAYDGVRRDFLMYSALVRKGGLVAFHDIVTKGDGHEVHRLWDELKKKYSFVEFIEDPASNMGIGLLVV